MVILNHLVQPKIKQIRVEPDEFLVEGNSNFSIICNISANYSHYVEFLFRSDESERFESLANISSAEESRFTWVATLYRERQRESNREYLCHLGDNNANFKIAANIIFMYSIYVMFIMVLKNMYRTFSYVYILAAYHDV